jgi:hypothetical protein
MKHSNLIIAAMLMALAAPVLADGNGAPPSSGNAKLDAARNECAEQAGKDSNGRPDRAEMDSCMQAKGFTKPAGREQNGKGPGSSGDAKLDAARKSCADEAGKDSNGRPDRAEMDSCMQAKGFAKPAGQ